jgi:selenocysteine-specific elongation factor
MAARSGTGPWRANIILDRPTVCYPGSRLILRRMSPKDLLGGAIVQNVAVDQDVAVDPDVAVDLYGRPARPSDLDDLQDPYLRLIEASHLKPLSLQAIAANANVTVDVVEAAVARLVASGNVVRLSKPVEFIGRRAYDDAYRAAAEVIRHRHATMPWHLGATVAEIASAAGIAQPLTARLLSAWRDDGRIACRADHWHASDFEPRLTAAQTDFIENAVRSGAGAALLPMSFDVVAAKIGASKVEGASDAFDTLVATGTLTKIGDDLYRRDQIERARAAVTDVLQNSRDGETMARLRDALGTSRRYTLPLLEHFDSIGLTVRDGDLRRLRSTAGKSAEKVQV